MKLDEYIIRRQSDAERAQVAGILAGGDVSLSRAYALRAAIEVAADSLDDETIQSYPELCQTWEPGVGYTAGQRVNCGGTVYTVLQDHTSQADWTPEAAPSLFAEVLGGQDGTVGEWSQPGSTNPYMKGDTVTHNGATWTSDIDNNVWEPGVYGWTQI